MTGADTANGQWEYSINGGTTWSNVGTPSNMSALLLDTAAKIHFVPNTNYNGSSGNVTFGAWDRTSGSNGQSGVDVSTNGGTTAFSTATDTASLMVNAVNHAPVLDNTGDMAVTTIAEDDTTSSGDTVAEIVASPGGDRITDVDAGAAEGFAVIGVDDTNGTWQHSTDNGTTWTAFGAVSNTSAVLLNTAAKIRFVPDVNFNGSAGNITFRAWDETSGSNGQTGVDVSTNGGVTAFSTATETASLEVFPVNDDPQFVADTYQFSLGYGVTEDIIVGRVLAFDPDAGDTLTYAIDPDPGTTTPEAVGRFKILSIGPVGRIEVAEDLGFGPPNLYELGVTVSDGAGGTDTATVDILMKTLVVITGDFHGVEDRPGPGIVDTITLEIYRIVEDFSTEPTLNVTYEVTWTSAARDDLDNPDVLVAAGATQGTVAIAPGAAGVILPLLVPHDDSNIEGKEFFTVEIVETDEYTTFHDTSKYQHHDLKDLNPGFNGYALAEIQILDGIVLFGKYNGTTVTDLHVVHITDVDQGLLSDCYFQAAIGAMALRDPDFIENELFTVNGDGTVTVQFHDPIGNPGGPSPPAVTVQLTLDKGWSQGGLSGDTEHQEGTADYRGKFEVWTIILEKAYAEYIGWADLIDGGASDVVWSHIYNVDETVNRVDTSTKTNSELEQIIRQAVSGGRKIVLGTAKIADGKKKDDYTLSNGQSLYGSHSYIVEGILGDEIDLHNPWGADHALLPFDDVKNVINNIYLD